jgi:hypothetical protein
MKVAFFTLIWFALLFAKPSHGFAAEATEIIAVVKLGVSLVEYIYDVYSDIFEGSDVTGMPSVEIEPSRYIGSFTKLSFHRKTSS